MRRQFGVDYPPPRPYVPEPIRPEPSKPDSPAYLKFQAWWAAFRANPPETPYADHAGTFTRVGAVLRERSKPSYEELEERRAIQAESGIG